MPLRSRAQAAFLKANHPAVFREFANATRKGTKLPYKVKHKRKPGDLIKAARKVDNKMHSFGDFNEATGKIRINKKMNKAKGDSGELINTEVHESLHAKNPRLTEKQVYSKTKKIVKKMSKKAKKKMYSRFR
jgi:hypothetical protein